MFPNRAITNFIPSAGGEIYPLQHDLRFSITRRDGESVVHTIGSFFPNIVGIGECEHVAMHDWSLQVHSIIQKHLANRANPTREQSPEEAAEWKLLCRFIDFKQYMTDKPVKIEKKLATVISNTPEPSVIQWDDGRVESIDETLMPPEFVAYDEDDRILITGTTDPHTLDLIQVFDIQPYRGENTTDQDNLEHQEPQKLRQATE